MNRWLMISAASIVLAGCASTRDTTNIAAPVATQSVEVSEILPLQATVLGTVKASVCGSDQPAALEQAKVQAAALGATAITRVRYNKLGVNALQGCWNGTIARALAYR